MKLQEVKKALEEIKRREQCRVDKETLLSKFPIEASVLIIAKEALTELNAYIARLESSGLVREVTCAIAKERNGKASVREAFAAINVIKEAQCSTNA